MHVLQNGIHNFSHKLETCTNIHQMYNSNYISYCILYCSPKTNVEKVKEIIAVAVTFITVKLTDKHEPRWAHNRTMIQVATTSVVSKHTGQAMLLTFPNHLFARLWPKAAKFKQYFFRFDLDLNCTPILIFLPPPCTIYMWKGLGGNLEDSEVFCTRQPIIRISVR